MRPKAPLAIGGAVAALLLALAGCTGRSAVSAAPKDAPTLPAVQSSTAPPPSTTPSQAATNEHGNLDKAFGQEAGLLGDDGSALLTFAVDAVHVDPHCTSDYSESPKNGHFLGIDLRVSTSSSLPADSFVSFSASDFSVIGPDGVTHTDVGDFEAYSCLADSQMFTSDPLGAGQKYVGTIVIDSPVTTGSLVLNGTTLGVGNAGGWEWQF